MAKDKSYIFDVATAVKYGLNAAVVIRNFQFWIEKNHANEKHRHDDRTWTYISVSAMTAIFPFFSTRQVRTILDNLIKSRVLVKGRFNLKGYDRTSWFAFEDEKSFVNFDKCIGQKRQKDSSKMTNASAGIDKPIPDTLTDTKPIIKSDMTGFSVEFLSSKKRDDERNRNTESEAMTLLISRGVNHSVTEDIVINKKTPLESIRNTIQNGLARQFWSSQKGGAWRLHAGYIVAALKKARRESKIVKPTKAHKDMMAMIEASKKPSKPPLSKKDFGKSRRKQTDRLKTAI